MVRPKRVSQEITGVCADHGAGLAGGVDTGFSGNNLVGVDCGFVLAGVSDLVGRVDAAVDVMIETMILW